MTRTKQPISSNVIADTASARTPTTGTGYGERVYGARAGVDDLAVLDMPTAA